MPKHRSKNAVSDDNIYHPSEGEIVKYQFPTKHIRHEEWVTALVIKVFKNSIELEIENKRLITHWIDRIKKHESRERSFHT
jgi:hypothetical protein